MRFSRFALFGIVLFAVHGCSGGDVTVSGKVTNKGAPLQLGKDIKLTLLFAPEAKQKHGNVDTTNTYPVGLDFETGQYTVQMPPGKYTARAVMFDNSKNPPKILPVNPNLSKTVHEFTSSRTGVDLDIAP
jgi:hypothetical protein